MGGYENNNGVIANGNFNAGDTDRQFVWLIESTNNTQKAFGLGINKINNATPYINTASQATGYAILGFFTAFRGGSSYSFTGEHSSMICDDEYNDIFEDVL